MKAPRRTSAIEPVRRRRPLTNVGGAIDTSGDATAAKALAHALEVAPDDREDAPDRAHVHGFHTYPARTHPVTAQRLVHAFSKEGDVVLDPFCGSGTVVVEAMLAGRDAIGIDLNPLAVMLARAKTYPHAKAKTEAFVEAAKEVAAFADARRKARAGATQRYPHADVAVFEPHVLLELDSLRSGIAKKAPPDQRPELGLVLSSIFVKVSRKKGDTTQERGDVPKRIAAGYPSRLFVKRAVDLARREDELFALLPSPAPRARIFEDDAASLAKVKDASVDAVITSPPYVATYDYLAHHELRLRWLGLDERALAGKEVGARRRYEKLGPREAREAWQRELEGLFVALARVTKKDAAVVLLIADSATAPGPRGEPPEALRADAIVAEVASRLKDSSTRAARRPALFPVARASQARPHFHGPTARAFELQARAEHAILLRRA